MNFQSKRLIFRRLKESDREDYYDMMRNPNVMDPVPRPIMSRATSDENFEKHSTSDFDKTDIKVLAVVRHDSNEFIGVAAFLVNYEGEPEIGYRLREKHWGIGFGTEVCQALIDFGFNQMDYELITADVNTKNEKSVKILDKFLNRDKEFHNTADNCWDRKYVLLKSDWMNRNA